MVADDGVNVIEQEACAPVPESPQVVADMPAPPPDHVMFPVGVVTVPESVSVTVAVHVEADPTRIGEPQASVVVVLRFTTRIRAPSSLPKCRASPA